MNEIVTNATNLPANLEDLSRFVLVGREKLTAVRAEIRAIQKVGLAREVAEQKRQEAQQLAEAVIDAEVRIGELMRQIPKASGRNQYTEDCLPTKTKQQALEDNGFSRDIGNQFEQMSKHPEAVAAAKAEAREADDIVTRSAVLDKIKAEKKRLEEENAELKKIVVELKDREPEVRVERVEVVPADYKAAKQKARAYDADLRTANNKITEANRAKREAEEKIQELEDKIAEISTETPQGEYFKNLEAWAVSFNTHCDQFIRWVGGYVWLTNNADKLDDAQLAGLVGSVQMVYEWAGTLLTNIQERTRGKYEHRDNETDQHYLIVADD